MEITKELKSEHKQILESFKKIDSLKNTKDKKKAFNQLKKVIIVHLNKKDNKIYPKLNDPIDNSNNSGKFFYKIMRANSKDLITLFEKAENEIFEESFEDIFSEIKDKLKKRAEIEESTIFPAYIATVKPN